VSDEAGFDAFVTTHSASLLRFAWVLTGSRHAGEDLVQDSLLKAWRRWGRVECANDPARYVRTIVVHTYVTARRRQWRREVPTERLPEEPTTEDGDLRLAFLAVLRDLPPRQRAVLALRYYADRTEAQTAESLGCSIGTVKSQSSKALETLRRHTGLAGLNDDEEVRR
jgi:RNA polymerase sigma-70 factor (sigma-E family)